MFQHYEKQGKIDGQWILEEKIAALLKTSMFSELETEVGKLKNQNFPKLSEQLNQAKTQISKEFAVSESVREFIDKLTEKHQDIEREKFSRTAVSKFCGEFNKEWLPDVLKYSKIRFETGNYLPALKLLSCLQNIYDEELVQILWGKLNCQLCLGLYEESKHDLFTLKKLLEDEKVFNGSHHLAVYSKSTLTHSALFTFFLKKSTDQDFEQFYEFLTSP